EREQAVRRHGGESPLLALEEPAVEAVAPAGPGIEARAGAQRDGDEMAAAPGERADARARLDGLVGALASQTEHVANQPELRRWIGERAAPLVPVDRPAVVRVDEAQALELVALVDVRDARAGQLQERLRERDPAPDRSQAPDERLDGDVAVQAPGVLLDAALVVDVRIEPVGAALPLAQRLLDVRIEPVARQRPCPDDLLEDHVRVVRIDSA